MAQDSVKKIGKAQTLAILIITAFIAILIGASTRTKGLFTTRPIYVILTPLMWPFGNKAKTSAEAEGRQPQSAPVNAWGLASQIPEQEPSDRATPEQELSDRATPEQEPSDRATPEQELSDRATPEQELSDRATPEQEPSDRATPEQELSDRATPEQELSDRATPEQELSDRATPEQELSDRATPEQELSDRATGDNEKEGGVEMTERLMDLLQEMAGEVDGLLAICVAGADGEPIAYYAPPGSRWNMELSAAQLAQLLKLARTSADKMQAGELEDTLLTTADSYVLTKSLADDSFWLGMATSRDAVLGMVRLIAKTYAGRLAEAVPK
jgi:predicted regulator of Ras-like GTPase activity (Roadblock/LC7/MglB family)